MGVRINVGCGPLARKSEVGFDIQQTTGVDIVAAAKALPLRDNSVEFVRFDHVLEHLSLHEVVTTLLELKRVLDLGGQIRVGVPDLEGSCRHYLEVDVREKPTVLHWIFGEQTNQHEFHKSGWDPETLRDLLETIGFRDVTVRPDDDIFRTEAVCIVGEGYK